MRRALRNLLVVIGLGAAALAGAPPAGALYLAAQLRPIDLLVSSGAGWQTVNDFQLAWGNPRSDGQDVAYAAIHLRLRNSSGNAILGEYTRRERETQLSRISVPGPGRYLADVWLEGPSGEIGEPATAILRFDDVRPGPVRPLTSSGWSAGDETVAVELEHPAGPWPVSGIRGYAVSVDDGSGSTPCGGPSECSLAETDLSGGVGDDRISLGLLPDGISVVRAVAVSVAGMRSQQVASAIVRVDTHDPEVSLDAPRGWVDGPARVMAAAVDSQSGMIADGPNGPYTALAVDGNVSRVELGDSAMAVVTGQGTHGVASYARDAAGNLDETAGRSAIVRIDETPPRVAFALAQDPAEPERIEATVSDALSGIDLGRGSVGIRPSGSKQRFLALPTVASRGRLVAHWDSDAFAPRTYEFRVTAYDAAGNVAESDRRADDTRMVLANPVKTPTRLEAGFGGASLVWQRCTRHGGERRCRRETVTPFESRPTRRTVPHGHGIAYGGRLSFPSGLAPEGLPIEVVENFAAGAVPARQTTIVRTGADGTFALELRPGPSRRIEAVFPGSRTLTRAGTGDVELRVQAGVRLRASSAVARIGGAPVIFSGRIDGLGAPIGPQGRPVELQFRLAGDEWSEFRTVQANARGRFRYRYAFSDNDSRGVRFQFRAYVPSQADWPYEPATSRPLFVTGR